MDMEFKEERKNVSKRSGNVKLKMTRENLRCCFLVILLLTLLCLLFLRQKMYSFDCLMHGAKFTGLLRFVDVVKIRLGM